MVDFAGLVTILTTYIPLMLFHCHNDTNVHNTDMMRLINTLFGHNKINYHDQK